MPGSPGLAVNKLNILEYKDGVHIQSYRLSQVGWGGWMGKVKISLNRRLQLNSEQWHFVLKFPLWYSRLYLSISMMAVFGWAGSWSR